MPGNSPRSAHATIRGYLYQTCLGVLRWLDLQPNEVLVCEGDEDLDRHLLDGIVVSEQVKAYSGRLGLGDQAVLESLFNFLRTYVALRREEKDRTFIFTTTAEPRQQRKTGLDFDLLEKWRDRIYTPEVIDAVRSLLEPEGDAKHRDEILAARVWLDAQPEGWLGFMKAVEWTFEAPDLDQIRRTIQSRLARGEKTRNLDADLFTDRLVVHVLEASSQPDINARTLTPAALSKLVEEDLSRWATSPHGRRIREAFDETARIQDLLNTGTDKLRDFKPGTLLTAAHEVIPFDETGRQKELDLLADWCEDAEPRSVLLLTGEGGSGKTRLMIEWCRRLRHHGWHAGFLRRGRQAIELDPFLKGTAPRLVVVDYAETQMVLVKPLLQQLASAEPGVGPKVRVVLLARREGDWWRNVFEEDGEIARLPKRSEVITSLVPLDIEKRREVFYRAMEGFAAQADNAVPSKAPLPDLAHKDFERVLFLHMAALAALEGERIGNAAEALHATLLHERRFWKKQVADLRLSGDLAPLLEQALEIAVAAVTLVQGCPTEQEAEALVVRCLKDLPLEKRHPRTVLGLLRTLYGGSEGENSRFIDPLQPDLLGEELVITALSNDSGIIDSLLTDCTSKEGYSLLTVLTRIAQKYPLHENWIGVALRGRLRMLAPLAFEVAVTTGDPIGMKLAQELESGWSNSLGEEMLELCESDQYHASIPLREACLTITEKMFLHFQRRLPDLESTELIRYAALANILGNRLSDLGRRDRALAMTQEAVSIYRQLAANGDEVQPFLAMSLNNLGDRLRELGRNDDVLKATQEAVNIYKSLAKNDPEIYIQSYATSVNNLAIALGELGQWEEALANSRKSIAIYREISTVDPDSVRPGLAMSLLNASNYLRHLGFRKEALDTARETSEIYRRLAEHRHDIYLPHLAISLESLSRNLEGSGLYQEALDVGRQSVDRKTSPFPKGPKGWVQAGGLELGNVIAPGWSRASEVARSR